jgi:hypothetical protein
MEPRLRRPRKGTRTDQEKVIPKQEKGVGLWEVFLEA